MVVGILDNYPGSTMTVKSKPLIILKIGVGQKLLVRQTTYMRKKKLETYLFKNCFIIRAQFQITVPGVW